MIIRIVGDTKKELSQDEESKLVKFLESLGVSEVEHITIND